MSPYRFLNRDLAKGRYEVDVPTHRRGERTGFRFALPVIKTLKSQLVQEFVNVIKDRIGVVLTCAICAVAVVEGEIHLFIMPPMTKKRFWFLTLSCRFACRTRLVGGWQEHGACRRRLDNKEIERCRYSGQFWYGGVITFLTS